MSKPNVVEIPLTLKISIEGDSKPRTVQILEPMAQTRPASSTHKPKRRSAKELPLERASRLLRQLFGRGQYVASSTILKHLTREFPTLNAGNLHQLKISLGYVSVYDTDLKDWFWTKGS